MKRFFSSLLVLAFALSCMTVSSAAATDLRALYPEISAANETEYEVVYSDENVEILIVTGSIQLPSTRTNQHDTAGTAYDTARIDFRCYASEGNRCTVNVDNTDDTADMKVTFDYTINGKDFNISRTVVPSDGVATVVRMDNNEDLTCTIYTTIQAVKASSVQYEYSARQYYL